ncbi:MAG: hypothetical protein HEQ24_01170 [Dolichospermum sp. BR01]|nr:hypothetical protein [Dolichospermum sp. BR01]
MGYRQKGRQKSSHNSRFSKINNFIINKSGLIRTKFNNINNNFLQQLPNLKQYLIQQKSSFLVIILLVILCIITIAAIVPGSHIFEGNLIFKEMSFTYNDNQPKLFIGNIKNIKELETEGKQKLTFTGSFQSQSLPEINKLNSLEIQLTERESKIIITPANSNTASEINLKELRLQPQTRIARLNYDFYRQQLAFSLLPNSQNNPNPLEIYLGEQPIKVIIEGYKIPSLKLPKSQDDQAQLEFIVNPNNKEFTFKIQENTDIYLTLSKPPKYESEQWFRGKIKTKDVTFTHVDRNGGNLRDDLEISTIVEGKIRMAGQDREIKENQFLMGEDTNKPLNIQLIRNLQIISDKKGIEARLSGKTKQIQIGLDQDFPVSSIQGSWLDGVLPRDAIIALFSFGAATVANLLSWLFSNTNSRKP